MTTVEQLLLFGFVDETAASSDLVTDSEFWDGTAVSLVPMAVARERSRAAQKCTCTWHEHAPRECGNFGESETLLTFTQVARILGMTLRQFRRVADTGSIEVVRVSKWSPRVRASELRCLVEAATGRHSKLAAMIGPAAGVAQVPSFHAIFRSRAPAGFRGRPASRNRVFRPSVATFPPISPSKASKRKE